MKNVLILTILAMGQRVQHILIRKKIVSYFHIFKTVPIKFRYLFRSSRKPDSDRALAKRRPRAEHNPRDGELYPAPELGRALLPQRGYSRVHHHLQGAKVLHLSGRFSAPGGLLHSPGTFVRRGKL